nr:MAG TPA: hypothetical protein [Crassvirales sp.]
MSLCTQIYCFYQMIKKESEVRPHLISHYKQ